jgi:drug/metabolite transporter (DMT)-like permease
MTAIPRGLLAIHAAVLLFGLSGLLGKLITAPPLVIVFSRTVLAALALGLLLVWRRQPVAAGAGRRMLMLAGAGLVLAAHWLTFFQAVQVSTVAVALLTFSTFPLFVTLLEPLWFEERLHLHDVLTAMTVLVGLALVVPRFDLDDRVAVGAAWGTLSGFTFALLALLNRRLVQSLSPVLVGAWQNAVAAVLLVPFLGAADWTWNARDVILLAVLGLVSTALAHVWFIYGLTHVRAQVAAIICALEPVYGIAMAVIVLGEAPSGRTALGGALIIGATLAAKRLRQRPVNIVGSTPASKLPASPL